MRHIFSQSFGHLRVKLLQNQLPFCFCSLSKDSSCLWSLVQPRIKHAYSTTSLLSQYTKYVYKIVSSKNVFLDVEKMPLILLTQKKILGVHGVSSSRAQPGLDNMEVGPSKWFLEPKSNKTIKLWGFHVRGDRRPVSDRESFKNLE